MSHKNMNINELASMLGFDYHRLTGMARRGEIPCQTICGEFRFHSTDIFTWLQDVLPTLTKPELIQMDAGMSECRGVAFFSRIISQLFHAPAVSPTLDARTQNSLKRKLVGLAGNTGCVYDSQILLDRLVLHTLPGGIALLHPDQALTDALAESFAVMARTQGPVMVNQGMYADLFFLCAAQDGVHHLHLLTRLCRLLQDHDLVDRLREAAAPSDVIEAFTHVEDTLMVCAV